MKPPCITVQEAVLEPSSSGHRFIRPSDGVPGKPQKTKRKMSTSTQRLTLVLEVLINKNTDV